MSSRLVVSLAPELREPLTIAARIAGMSLAALASALIADKLGVLLPRERDEPPRPTLREPPLTSKLP